MTQQTSNFEIISGFILVIVGGIFCGLGLYVDYLIIRSHYTLSIQTLAFGAGPYDWEGAGLISLTFGIVLIALDLYRNHL